MQKKKRRNQQKTTVSLDNQKHFATILKATSMKTEYEIRMKITFLTQENVFHVVEDCWKTQTLLIIQQFFLFPCCFLYSSKNIYQIMTEALFYFSETSGKIVFVPLPCTKKKQKLCNYLKYILPNLDKSLKFVKWFGCKVLFSVFLCF